MNKVLLALVGVLVLISCHSNPVVFHESKSLGGSWGSREAIAFQLSELDTIKDYNLYVNLRNTNDYPFNNIFLIVSMDFPHGKTVVDTLEYRMAYPDGSWMGQGIGNVKESKLWYKEGIRFFENGTYKVSITHAMRNNGEVEGVRNLEGIVDVGFTVEESSNH